MSSDATPTRREITADLLNRYDRPGPRYTSYPTAVEFHEGVGAACYEARLDAANRFEEEPLSLYLHLPFCHHRCLFCGCHVIVTPHEDRAAPYIGLLKKEIDLVAERLPDRRRVSQLHLGGGTPTYYHPRQLEDLIRHLLSRFTLAEGAEVAVEVDPRVTTSEHVDTLADLGFNRVSLGVQDFTPEVQEAIERIQSEEETRAIVDRARSRGFRGINLDLIYGLPYQTPETFERTIETVLDIAPDRTAVYSFAFVPWMRAHMKKIGDDDLPGRETKFALFGIARERFLGAGYEPIGMDHFARPDDELAVAKRRRKLRRNFQGYTVIPAPDVVGLGISAIGDVRSAYIQNEKKLVDYERRVTEGALPVERGIELSADDEVRRAVIHELMCNFGIDVPAIESAFGIPFFEYFDEDVRRLRLHEEEGMVEILPDRIAATPTGELFIRNLAMCFDRYWREKHEDSDKPTFSRTV